MDNSNGGKHLSSQGLKKLTLSKLFSFLKGGEITMLVNLNGTLVEIEAAITVTTLLEIKGLQAQGIIVVLNDNVLAKEEWSQKTLNDGDNIELLRFLGGG